MARSRFAVQFANLAFLHVVRDQMDWETFPDHFVFELQQFIPDVELVISPPLSVILQYFLESVHSKSPVFICALPNSVIPISFRPVDYSFPPQPYQSIAHLS